MIEVRRLRREDVPDVLAISLVELGEDYLDEDDFLDAIDAEGQFCNVAVMDGRSVGFAICQVFGPEGEEEFLHLPDCPERDQVLSMGRIGLLDSVSVSDSAKGHGIGSVMCSRCVDDMRDMGCDMVCAMAWKSVTGVTNIAGILRKMGLEETVAVQGYWNTMVDSPEGHHCPVCGAPCKCYGVFWKRLL